jgi:small subunit ribosomal protein S17
VDEGAPMASTEAMEEPTAAAEAEVDPGTAEEDAAPQPEPADDDVEPLQEQAEETEPAAAADAAVADASAIAEEVPAAETEPTPSAPAQPERKKRKRLPRALRPKKGRVQREKSAERKPITRVPRPEKEFGRRQERQGTVVSDKGDKTIVVKVDTIKAHPRYKKVVRRSKKFHAHDEQNQAKVGDVVRIVETRPLSKTKNWRLAEIVEVAK